MTVKIKLTISEYMPLDSKMRDKISQSEEGKNILIMWDAQEKLKGGLKSDAWLTAKEFTILYKNTIKDLKNSDYITKNSIYAVPTDKEFAKMLAESISIFMRPEMKYMWDVTPHLKGRSLKKNADEMNEFNMHMLKKPELCNVPSSKIKKDVYGRAGVPDEHGNISDPAQKIFEALKAYYEKSLEGVRIPIRDLLVIRDIIELKWDTDFYIQNKPSRLRYEA